MKVFILHVSDEEDHFNIQLGLEGEGLTAHATREIAEQELDEFVTVDWDEEWGTIPEDVLERREAYFGHFKENGADEPGKRTWSITEVEVRKS